jgi:histone H3/H4
MQKAGRRSEYSIPRTVFRRLVRQILMELGRRPGTRFNADAALALHVASEGYMEETFLLASRLLQTDRRITLSKEHMQSIISLRDYVVRPPY